MTQQPSRHLAPPPRKSLLPAFRTTKPPDANNPNTTKRNANAKKLTAKPSSTVSKTPMMTATLSSAKTATKTSKTAKSVVKPTNQLTIANIFPLALKPSSNTSFTSVNATNSPPKTTIVVNDIVINDTIAHNAHHLSSHGNNHPNTSRPHNDQTDSSDASHPFFLPTSTTANLATGPTLASADNSTNNNNSLATMLLDHTPAFFRCTGDDSAPSDVFYSFLPASSTSNADQCSTLVNDKLSNTNYNASFANSTRRHSNDSRHVASTDATHDQCINASTHNSSSTTADDHNHRPCPPSNAVNIQIDKLHYASSNNCLPKHNYCVDATKQHHRRHHRNTSDDSTIPTNMPTPKTATAKPTPTQPTMTTPLPQTTTTKRSTTTSTITISPAKVLTTRTPMTPTTKISPPKMKTTSESPDRQDLHN